MRKNETKRKMILSMTGTLVAAVIGCLVLVLEKYRPFVLLMIVAVWSVYLLSQLRKVDNLKDKHKKEHAMKIIDLEPDYKMLFSQQIQLRVQEKIRTKFPGAAVELCEKDIQRLVTLGKPVYVPIRKADDFCHISIQLKGNGEIQMNLFSLVGLEQVQEVKAEVSEQPELDTEQWFTQKGQQLLTELITNMNSRGYTRLSISENGDVTVKENGRNVRKDHFQEIPPKKHWERLKELMSDEDIQVQVSGRQLTFEW